MSWFQQYFSLQVIHLDASNGYVLLDAGSIHLAIKGSADAPLPHGVLLQWQVENLDAFQTEVTDKGCRVLKPIKESEEGYRRCVLEGPEGIPILVYETMREEYSVGEK
ncbi:MAG: hypothetical protein JNJ77_13320 [Planctomycetia bacterium]|nr:hypothetical protein [Planctomycetia bacterium]